MTSIEIRTKFKEFFESKGHSWIPSASLVPENDPSVLFTTAGMHPLVPYLLGEKHPEGSRLANTQRCLRTDDIDEVGDSVHLTFFEMLGFWSLGDYFKEKSIPYTWELFTGVDGFGLDPTKMAASVFAGDADASADSEAEELWLKQPGFLGEHRIAHLGKGDNWWPTGGGSGGPCGPDTEIFYWTGQGEAPREFDPRNKNWVEIGNNVFMQFNRELDGTYSPLRQKNVDTGLGFERIVTVMQGKSNVFETDLFTPIIEKIRHTGVSVEQKSERIIADHMRAVVFMAMDGVLPSNKDQGYIMRRLLRRAIVHFNKRELSENSINLLSETIVPEIIDRYSGAYPELATKSEHIKTTIQTEEKKFFQTLRGGFKRVQSLARNLKENDTIPGQVMFDLFTTYGIPVEIQLEIFTFYSNFHLRSGQAEFDQLFAEHQQKSRVGAEQKFRGGLADHSERVVRMHTATHLLHEALRRVLGEHVEQRGSNITSERLRFDFVQDSKLTEPELKQVEDLVNDIIEQDLPVEREILSREEALKLGARSIFGEKYGDQVSVYSIGPDEAGNYFSREFCGGPHVQHTAEIGMFKIIKEEAVSAGIRRIKATLR